MSIYGDVETRLATIPGMTVGTNIFSPEHPQLDPSATLPTIAIKRISDGGDYTLEVARALRQDRFQLTFAAETEVGLSVLVGLAETALNGKHTTFSASPLGLGSDGHDPVPECFWVKGDWLIFQ